MNSVTHVGLDVHKESTAVAVLRGDAVEPDHRVIASTPEAYRKLVARLASAEVVFCYEAGPCGYDPYRILTSLGARCEVIAPSLIPRRSGDRVKTDRLDARNLARLHRAGEFSRSGFLASSRKRSGTSFGSVRTSTTIGVAPSWASRPSCCATAPGPPRVGTPGMTTGRAACAWSCRQPKRPSTRCWARSRPATFSSAASTPRSATGSTREPLAGPVARLRTLRGIDTLSAATLAAEVCDFRAFANAPAFMGFTGLVPSEHSSGARTQHGSITKAGNHHVRRVLVEAAWSYRHRPAVGYALRRRRDHQPQALIAHSWAAQHRLHTKFATVAARHDRNVAVVAVARALAGFVWASMTESYATEN